jgi:hypothetical protein
MDWQWAATRVLVRLAQGLSVLNGLLDSEEAWCGFLYSSEINANERSLQQSAEGIIAARRRFLQVF